MINALSIDLEDWFCVYNLSSIIKKPDWDKCELRVEESTRKILRILEKFQTNATFFVLGWIADKVPNLIKEIERRGHEIALHGYGHTLITKLKPSEFEEDIKKGLESLEKIGVDQKIIGYRAPSFTVVEKTFWALDILEKYGIKYDSSVFPVGFHPDYGIPDAPLVPYKITENLFEFPLSVANVFGKRVPCSGGGYFRIYPYFFTRYLIGKINKDKRPVVFYLHPWEIDTGQPKIKLPLTKRIRHYFNINKTEQRLEKLLTHFKFNTIKNVLGI